MTVSPLGSQEVDEEDVDERVVARAERLLRKRWITEHPDDSVIFEEEADELRYHQKRSSALPCLVAGFCALREENRRLREAGQGLLEQYEQSQQESRKAYGDAVYWRTIAEEVAPGSGASPRDVAPEGDEGYAAGNKLVDELTDELGDVSAVQALGDTISAIHGGEVDLDYDVDGSVGDIYSEVGHQDDSGSDVYAWVCGDLTVSGEERAPVNRQRSRSF